MWKYCGSISQLSFLILYIIFPFFRPYISSSFFFFSLVFSPPYTYAHSCFNPPPFFLLLFLFLLDSRTCLSFSLSSSLFFYFFLFSFFYLIPKHSLALRDKKRRKRQREKEQVRDLACSTVDQRIQVGGESVFTVPSHAFHSATTHLPPLRSLDGSDGLCLFFSFLFCFYCYD